MAVVHGTKRVREVVEAVLAGDKSLDLIEVMVSRSFLLVTIENPHIIRRHVQEDVSEEVESLRHQALTLM